LAPRGSNELAGALTKLEHDNNRVFDSMKTSRLFIVRAFISLVAAALAVSSARSDTNRYAGSTWAFEDSTKVLAAAADISTAKYPDCDQATVEQKMVRVYRSDGTGECQDETFVKVLTEKGKRANRTLSLSFMLPYSTEEVVKLEVMKPDGEVVPVDVAANSKETIDDSQMSMNIYDPNMRVLRVNLPKVEIGDVVHSITRQTIERPYIPGQYAEENVFEGSGYIRHLSYEVHAPSDRPLQRIALRDEIPGTLRHSAQTNADSTIEYRWEVANVPRMFDEPSMPPYEMVLQRLYVSTTPDWQAVSKWYWELSKPHLEATTPEMKKTVDELTAGAKTDVDKIKAVFYHVSKKIRYMGLTPEKDRPGFEPHDVKLTFDKKYGVCRDKAALLVSMLRAAGLNAYPVLISVGVKRDVEVPDPFFNHAIVSVELKKGEYVLMDPTDENTRELLPSYDCNQSYLICRAEGERLLISPIEPPEGHMMRVKTTGVLSADGALEAKSELSFEGINDDAYRNMFSHLKPDDKRRFFERNLKQAMPGAKLKSFKLTPEDMLDVSTGVRAELEFSVDGMTASGSGKSVVTVPWIGKGLGVVNFILGGAGLEKRKYPMQTEVTCGLQEDISIQLGGGFAGAVSMPACSPMDDECMSYQQRFDHRNKTLDCSRELKLKVVEFTPEQYLKLKRTLKELEYDGRKTPVMAMARNAAVKPAATADQPAETPVESDAKILESHKELNVTDPHTAIYRVKYSKSILSYNGKIREAELKIDYNPSCQEARLIRGVVISKTGARQEISKDEMNVMDAGWNASAKRYTGGKILVANLPGVDIGSTIEVEFEIVSKGKPFLSGFESFQMPDELEHKSFQLTAPAGVRIQKMVSGAAGIIKEGDKTANGRQTFQWQADNVKALPAESQLPPEWIYSATVGYFVGDAGAYFKELRQAMLDRSQKSAKAAELARQLAGTAKTRLDAVKAIRDFIVKSIRLAGPSFTELPLTELSAADTTLADGYGHLADRAILFHAMLAAAGFRPEFVLASDLPPIKGIASVAKSFPLPQNFQAPLVRIVVDGETYYLNDTDQYSQLGTTSHDGRLGIVLASQAREVIQAAKGCQEKTETAYTLSVADDGKAQIGVARHYYGANYNQKNRYFSELPPEERKRYYQEVVSHMAQGARPVSDLTTKFDTYPGVEKFTVEIDNYSVVDGKYLYFDLPFTPSLFPPGADHRVLPLFISRGNESTIRTEIQLPPGFRRIVIAPNSGKLDAPAGSGRARITSKSEAGKCVITQEFDTEPAIISPKDYPALLKVESALGKKSSKVFLLEEEPAAAKNGAGPTK
jgi:transglutaminase-like putative cysteine protease